MRIPKIILGLALLTSMLSAQSLWNANRPQASLFSDTSARNVGDILTVIVTETQRIVNKEQSEFKKELGLDAALTNFNILPSAFNPLPSIGGNSSREFKADVKYDKRGSLETRISVVVIDVLPNGTLVVEGRRHITMDREDKTIRLSGLVRPYDVTSVNTISSSQIANASISYEGLGPMTNASNRGWLSELIDYAWPF